MQDRKFMITIAGTVVAAGGLLLLSACSREPGESAAAGSGAAQEAAVLPSFAVDPDAPVLATAYPRLASGALTYARLMPLPEGVLLRTDALSLGTAELEAELQDIPPMHREVLRQNAFLLLEQIATGALLEQEARRDLAARGQDVAAMPRDRLLQTWMGDLVAGVTVSDAELEAFYHENQDMMGGASFDRVRSQLIQHITQEKQQAAVEAHIQGIGQRIDIALDAAWAGTQDVAMRDNAVDRARDSGRPTLASFGADSCIPCQMMKPFREAIAHEYEGVINVVYVHVNEDQMLASRYRVRGIPHVLFFDHDGNEFLSRTGLMTQDQMEAVLTEMGVDKPSGQSGNE